MPGEKIPIGKEELEGLMHRPLEEYESVNFPHNVGNGVIAPKDILQRILEEGLGESVRYLKPVDEKGYKSGDIFKAADNRFYLYLGRIKSGIFEGDDLLINLGGDTIDAGRFELDSVYGELFCPSWRIFPP